METIREGLDPVRKLLGVRLDFACVIRTVGGPDTSVEVEILIAGVAESCGNHGVCHFVDEALVDVVLKVIPSTPSECRSSSNTYSCAVFVCSCALCYAHAVRALCYFMLRALCPPLSRLDTGDSARSRSRAVVCFGIGSSETYQLSELQGV